AAEWSRVSAGLAQRAMLLNMVLADLYGPQRLLAEGLLPPELVYLNPGFLRSCHGWMVPRGRYLYLYAGHLARDQAGQWLVLADKARGPTGAGYAIENRIVISRMIPDVFRDCQVQRLAAFFLSMRDTLQELVPTRGTPRIVLLSPGPTSPTYFEDAYLARYLGFALVEGGDLTVRDNCVYLKTLGGLLQVDVILRRVRDEDCDPLEQRSDSTHGVSGLTHAARSGNVALVNALGCSLLESPAVIPFLPTLAKFFLREDLLLPSVPSWWCGDDAAREFVLSNLETLVIKPSFPQPAIGPIYGARLTGQQRDDLRARIRHQPQDYVAQELIAGSTAPAWNSGAVQPTYVALRTFAFVKDEHYDVMPGGLARVSLSPDALGESALGGQGSKDVWVLSEGPVADVTLLHPAGAPISLQRSTSDLPSRVADHLYWLGRHAERTEGVARLVRSLVARLTSEGATGSSPSARALLRALSDQGRVRPEFAVHLGGQKIPQIEHEILAAIFDPTRTGSLRAMLTALHRAAAVVRDRISIDSWRILNSLALELAPPSSADAQVALADVLSLLNGLILDLSAFSGMGTESMTRGPGWRFLDMGRRIERGQQGLSLLRSTLVEPQADEDPVFEGLLEIADSSMTYRNRYLTNLQLPPLLDLLLTDETNPRSVAYQASALNDHVEALPRGASQLLLASEQRVALALLTDLRLSDVYALAKLDASGERTMLHEFLENCAAHFRTLSDEITTHYLIHAGPSRQIGEIRPG
ncbi:MAG TPA: circularly permuted type 2 ATP-grasp protein, partial [Pirellulaceae bacterium]|nr:circularly permuted type 2 ATP-grasp protein [Pirellulaceae bacterium]